jgi:hypothetical protein
MNMNASFPGSARVSRVGFGVAPKQSFLAHRLVACREGQTKVRDREDALASTRDACATRNR